MPIPDKSQDNKAKINTLVIDNSVIEILLDTNIGYEAFINQVLTNRIIKRKFLLLAGLNNKIARTSRLDDTLAALIDKINADLDSLKTEDAIKYFEMLSQIQSNDSLQLKSMFTELLKMMVK